MRIAIITQDEKLYLPSAISHLLRHLEGQVVFGVVLPSFNEGRWQNLRRFLRLMGPRDTFRLVRKYFAASVLDRFNRIRPVTKPFSAEETFRRFRIPFAKCAEVNDPVFLNEVLRPLGLDLIVSIAASQIFKPVLLSLPKFGCINLHSSPLPKYRGMMPNFWAMVSGDRETCVTVHRMDERLDTGALILQKAVAIPPGDSLDALMTRSKVVGAAALLEAIALIDEGRCVTVPLDMTKGSYHHFPGAEEGRRLRSLGHRFF